MEAILLGAVPVAFNHPTIRELLPSEMSPKCLCPLYDLKCLYSKVKNLLLDEDIEFGSISKDLRRYLFEKLNKDDIFNTLFE
jgi:hypothetical protein